MVIEFKGKGPSKKVHPDLLFAEELFYKPSGLVLQNLEQGKEGSEYGASEFTINDRFVKFRVGKVTPTKIGQFVTFWKRIGKGPILPYDLIDSFDFLVISARSENHFGQFIFPKTVLYEKGMISGSEKEGKRAMRIYPPWDKTDNSQAKKTQAWQLQYFIKLNEQFDSAHLKYLFDVH